jgi:predicted phosphodiesterase/signal recognition particle subunit SEC65
MERNPNFEQQPRFVVNPEGIIRDDRTPQEIIFREPRYEKIKEIVENLKLIGIKKNDSPAPKVEPISKGEKKKPTIKDSQTWNMNFQKKELKKEIQGEIENLQDRQLKLSKEKLNPYWEYTFNKNKQDLLGLGDFHFGARTCDVPKIRKEIKAIKKYGTAVICMGDLIENANRYSVGAGVYEQVMTPMKQLEGVYQLLEPIKGQIMAMIDGNHEFRTMKECGFNPTQILADRLGVPYTGWEAFVRMKVKDFNYIAYATHGSTAARFFWTRVKALEDVMRHVDADIVLYAHTHSKMYHEIRYKGIKEKKKVGVLTGAFLKDDPFGYATMKNLPPIKTGIIPLKLSGTHWDIHGKD